MHVLGRSLTQSRSSVPRPDGVFGGPNKLLRRALYVLVAGGSASDKEVTPGSLRGTRLVVLAEAHRCFRTAILRSRLSAWLLERVSLSPANLASVLRALNSPRAMEDDLVLSDYNFARRSNTV
mgnify:CR=1 FL=1